MVTSVIYENRNSGVAIDVCTEYKPEFDEFLNNIVWGADGFLYSENIRLSDLSRFSRVHYVRLTKGDQLTGLAAVQEKPILVGKKYVNAYYMTNFAVSNQVKSSIYASLMVKYATRHFKDMLGDSGLLYAYVEGDNLASKRIANKYGYNKIRTFQSVMFFKPFCRTHPEVRNIEASEKEQILKRIESIYTEQVFTDFKSSLHAEDYFVIEKNGRIVAGVQCDSMKWSVKAYPGISGYLLLRVLPRIPILNKVINPDDLLFLKISNIFVEPNHEAELRLLIKSLLKRNQTRLGLVQFDPSCTVLNRIIDQCGLGSIQLAGEVEFSAVLHNFPQSMANLIARSPLHISIGDK